MLTDAVYGAECSAIGDKDTVKATKRGNHVLCQRPDVLLRNGIGQHQFKQGLVSERVGLACNEALPEPLPVS